MYWVHSVSSFLLLLLCDFPCWTFLSLESQMSMCEVWMCELEEIVSFFSSLWLLAMFWVHTYLLTSPHDFRQCFECTCILFLLLAPLWLSLMIVFEFWISSVYVGCEHVNVGWTTSSFLSCAPCNYLCWFIVTVNDYCNCWNVFPIETFIILAKIEAHFIIMLLH
jgi:hypothetical protein